MISGEGNITLVNIFRYVCFVMLSLTMLDKCQL